MQDGFFSPIVHQWAIHRLPGGAIHGKSRQGTRGFGHVFFGVIAFTKGKQLHQFSGEIFIGMAGAALGLIEPNQHGRITGDFPQERPPGASSVTAKQRLLTPHQVGLLDLDHAGGEMPVPKQGQLFLKRSGGMDHTLQPPLLHRHGFTYRAPTVILGHLLPFFRCRRLHSLEISHVFWVKARPSRVGDIRRAGGKIDQPIHGLPNGKCGQGLDLQRSPAKSSPIEQMGGGRKIPTGRW